MIPSCCRCWLPVHPFTRKLHLALVRFDGTSSRGHVAGDIFRLRSIYRVIWAVNIGSAGLLWFCIPFGLSMSCVLRRHLLGAIVMEWALLSAAIRALLASLCYFDLLSVHSSRFRWLLCIAPGLATTSIYISMITHSGFHLHCFSLYYVSRTIRICQRSFYIRIYFLITKDLHRFVLSIFLSVCTVYHEIYLFTFCLL